MNAVLKYPGSKWRLAEWIISFFPEHHSYLEPFFGSGAVLQDPDSRAVMLMNEQIINLIDVKAIGEQEDAPVGPAMIDNGSAVYWWSATMAFTAGRYNPNGSKMQELVDCLKQINVQEACEL